MRMMLKKIIYNNNRLKIQKFKFNKPEISDKSINLFLVASIPVIRMTTY